MALRGPVVVVIGRCHVAVGLVVLLVGWAAPVRLVAQADSAALHATLRGWQEETWLQLLDRGGAIGGRLSRAGMLQRFQPLIDDEYYIDLISGRFGLSEDYLWYQQPSGARYWGASIDHLELVTAFEVKAAIPLGGAWTGTVRFNKEHSHEVRRDLVHVEFARTWRAGVFGGVHGTLNPVKPDIDLELRGGYRRDNGREIGGAVGVLDTFSDIIYQVLVVWEGYADTALDYERQPLTLRTWAEWPIARHLRVEVHGGVMTPTTVRAYRQVAPDVGFRQLERFGFAGGLLEWDATSRLRIGGFGTYVRARTDRTPLPLSPPEDDFVLTEITTRYGGYTLAQLAERWRFEGWLARTARPERRDQRQPGTPDVDFEDRWLSGEARLTYGGQRGFRGDASFELVARDVVRGLGQVPATDSRDNSRLRLEVGWLFGERASFRAGYRLDLDGDPGQGKGAFDGAEGRFVVYW